MMAEERVACKMAPGQRHIVCCALCRVSCSRVCVCVCVCFVELKSVKVEGEELAVCGCVCRGCFE